MSQKKKILIIEDDPNIVDLAEIHIKDLGLDLEWAADGLTGLDQFQKGEYELVILDLMLPELDGFEVCKRIREENKYTPILMLTAKSEELDKVLGLELGADDYITKPLSVRELIARVKAVLRRRQVDKEESGDTGTDKPLRFGDHIPLFTHFFIASIFFYFADNLTNSLFIFGMFIWR